MQGARNRRVCKTILLILMLDFYLVEQENARGFSKKTWQNLWLEALKKWRE